MRTLGNWVLIFGVSALWQFGLGKLFLSVGRSAPWTLSWTGNATLAYGAFAGVASLVAVLIFLSLIREKLSVNGFSLSRTADWKKAFLLFWILFPVFLAGRLLDPSFDQWFVTQNGLSIAGALGGFAVVIAVFVFHEELLERFLQGRLIAVVPTPLALIGLSINFALLHRTASSAEHSIGLVISAFFGSLVLAALFTLTRNVLVMIGFHLTLNFVSLLGILLHARGSFLGELLFWSVFAILFIITIRPAVALLQAGITTGKQAKAPGLAYVALILFAVGIPLAVWLW